MNGKGEHEPPDPGLEEEQSGDAWLFRLFRDYFLDARDTLLDDPEHGRLVRLLMIDHFHSCGGGGVGDPERPLLGVADLRVIDPHLPVTAIRRLVGELEAAGLVARAARPEGPPRWAWVEGAELPAWVIAYRTEIREQMAAEGFGVPPV